MRIHKTTAWAITAIGLLAMGEVPSCFATTTQFNNNRTGWAAASSNLNTIDFNNLTAASDFAFQPSLTTGGVTFASFYSTFASNNVLIKNTENWGTGNYLLGPSQDQFGNYSLKITLPSARTSFGTDIMYNGSYASTFQVTLSSGATLTTATTLPNHTGPAFFGFTTDTAVTYLIFTPTYVASIEPRLVIDNVSFADAGGGAPVDPPVDTPEAATLALCGAGLLLFQALRRRGGMTPA